MEGYTEASGVFDTFYLDYLELARRECGDSLLQYGHRENQDKILDQILSQVKAKLVELCARTLVCEFKNYREKRKQKEKAYELFDAQFKNRGYVKKLLEKYPVLRELLDQETSRFVHNLATILKRLDTDKREIEETFGRNLGMLTSVELGSGDTHNGGKSVAILHFENGSVVYKPHSLYTDFAFMEICRLLTDKAGSIDLKCAKTLSREQYGWQQWVDYQECTSDAMVRRYCRRLGALLAIFRVMKTTDVHMENIIPCGEYPIVIDLETLTCNGIIDRSRGDVISSFQEEYFNSVLSTCLLPNRGVNPMLDLDISGLGAGEEQKSQKLKWERVVNRGTEEIDIREEMAESFYERVLRLNGKNINYSLYLEQIKEGFQSAYRLLSENSKEILDTAEKYLKRAKFRQVLRGTFIYDRFLRAACNPRYLSCSKEYERVLSIINVNGTSREKDEFRQLQDFDIPYFYSTYGERHLYSSKGLVEENYFNRSIREELEENFTNKLHPGDCVKQINLIQNSFCFSYGKKGRNPYTDELPLLDTVDQDKNIQQITGHIKKLAVWNPAGSKCTFYDLGISPSGDYKIDILGNGLYHGAGLIIYLHAYAAKTGLEEDRQFARAALAGFEEQYDAGKLPVNTSVFSGFSGQLYMYYVLSKQENDNYCRDKFRELLERLEACEENTEESAEDIIGGASGLLLVLCRIYEELGGKRIEALIARYSERLYLHTKTLGVKWNGFAHGRSGEAAALAAAGAAIKVKKYREQGLELFRQENQFYIEKEKNWKDLRKDSGDSWMWCHGAPGCLLARTIAVQYNPAWKEFLIDSRFRDSWERLSKEFLEVSKGDCICHGSFGNFDILNYIFESNLIGIDLGRERRSSCLQAMIERVNRNGLVLGVAGARGIVSFMLGLSGIGYTLMRYQDKTLPSILALEV